MKAGHVKRCLAAPTNQSNSIPGTGGSDRKRARFACISCRKKKIRCDGNEPCAPCVASKSSCSFRTPMNSSSLPSSNRGFEAPAIVYLDLGLNDPDVEDPIVGVVDTTSVNFISDNSQRHDHSFNGVEFEPLPAPDPSTIESNCQNGVETGFSEHSGTNTYDSMMGNVPDMPTSSENILSDFPDIGGMEDYWQMLPMVFLQSCNLGDTNVSQNTPFWFSESDFTANDVFLDSNSPLLDHIVPSSMQNLTASMQEYFDGKSRPPSPSLNKASRKWYSAPPNLHDHNKDIVTIFLNIFRKHIPKTFSLFEETTVSPKGRAAYTLAMAATGGLFCTVLGSATVAKSMYNDARRLLLASVSIMILLEIPSLRLYRSTQRHLWMNSL